MPQILVKLLKIFEDPRKIYELVLGFCLLLLLSTLTFFHVFDSLEMLCLDLRFQLRGPQAMSSNIMVIGIDEASLDYVGRWPWARDIHGKLIDILNNKKFRPSSLFFDMVFEEPDKSAPKSDAELQYRAKQFKNYLLMAYFFEKGISKTFTERFESFPEKEKYLQAFAITNITEMPERLENYDKVSLPYLELSQVSQLAFVNTPNDKDGRNRKAQLLGRYKEKIYPSAHLLVALDHWGASVKDVQLMKRKIVVDTPQGQKTIPIDSKGQLLINYYDHFQHLPQVSFVEILNGRVAWTKGEKIPEGLIAMKDKIAIVGVTAMGIGDRKTTPFLEYEPGVFIHAQTIANILEQKFLVRAPLWKSILGLWFIGTLMILTTMFMKVNRCLMMAVALVAAHFSWTQFFFVEGTWLDFVATAVTVAVLFVGITSFRYFTALEELKRTQSQLIQAAKLASLGEMSAGIAHEFRNILNAVNLNVECLTRPDLPPEKMLKYGEMLKRIMGSANAILEGLLVFSRQSESVKSLGNLKVTVQDTMLLLEKEMIRHQIELTVELDDVPQSSFDKGQISQVVMNMVNNSRDALKERENKTIKVALKEEPERLRLDIEDNGSGIPPQVLKRLFQPFVTSKPAGKGTGLGLSVCHGIIRSHGGDIKVTTVQNQGTTWHIYLPKK